MSMGTDLKIVHLADAPHAQLEEPAPRTNSQTEGQTESSVEVWGSPAGVAKTGIWEASAGIFRGARIGSYEICYVIAGRATLVGDDGQEAEVKAGSHFIVPDGWTGMWHVHEAIRKMYTVIVDTPA